MEKRIELERRARRANQITELNLDNCRSTSIVGLTDEYTALESLSLINVGLTTLKGFPKLPNLKRLELSDNRISNGLNYLTTSPKLAYLNLSGNKIKDLEALKPLEAFENLAVLDLFNNEATQIENYREKIFEMIPSLEFLDGFDANDEEAPSEGDDDDEVNGNDSEDEGKNAFCINGLEIDLDELEQFEKRLQAKKSQPSTSGQYTIASNVSASNETDDLDDYLRELQLKESSKADNNDTVANSENQLDIPPRPPTNFPLLLYWFLALLNLISAAYFSDEILEDEDDGEEGDEDEEDESDDEDNGDVSLAEVYNEDLEEDNSEWDEEDGEDDDDDDESDEEEADGEAAATAAEPAADQKETDTAEEPQARGKKRKHDG